MDKNKLSKILEDHHLWLIGKGGCRADLSYADLSYADLSDADLRDADLRDADLRYADLSDADLSDADLSGANLRGADLRGANLRGAKLDNVITNADTAFYALQCPEKGAYIGWKKARGLIVELRITEDAQRSSATSRKCRASKAEVLSITNPDGSPGGNCVASKRDPNFIYTVGSTVEVPDFDPDRWTECAAGIHHFITRAEAVGYIE